MYALTLFHYDLECPTGFFPDWLLVMGALAGNFTDKPVNARSIYIAAHDLEAAMNSLFSFLIINIGERCKFWY
jgi:hypothetical protein